MKYQNLIIGAIILLAMALIIFIYITDNDLTLTEEEAIDIADQHENMISWKNQFTNHKRTVHHYDDYIDVSYCSVGEDTAGSCITITVYENKSIELPLVSV